jgi:hypothetical protein
MHFGTQQIIKSAEARKRHCYFTDGHEQDMKNYSLCKHINKFYAMKPEKHA